ncbi:S-adenosyl-L-methionine-dependent methyltransferase [Phytophthora cactorum]|nr:S-adenosyl-L-methionine-dependent methyltransferase [Phytophthora cactorum]
MATVCVNAVDGAAVTRDERCILYTSAVHCAHKYVRVSSELRVAFALLRRHENGSVASFGLLEALELSGDLETLQVESAADDDADAGAAKCKCKSGVVASVRVAFLDRKRPPSITSELGGVEKYARRLLQSILQRLGTEECRNVTVRSSVGALVSGLPGIGKTALAKAICKSLGVKTVFLNAADIFQTYVGQSEKQLVKIFESAVLQAPSILLIDGIERSLAIDALLLIHKVFVLSTTSRPGDVDAAVLSNGRLDLVVSIEPPTQSERLEILRIMTKTWQVDELDNKFLSQLSESTGGFVGADLLSLCQKALQQALAVTYPSVLQTHHVSQKQQQPTSTSIQKHGDINSASQGAFSGVFGMDDAIQTLRVSLIEPLEDCSRFLRFGTTPPKGVLLTGPPGSGKTHLANAVAEEVRRRGLASFVSVQCSDLLTKIVGDTEKALRELFATARMLLPIESIAPLRGFDTSTEQTFDRMLTRMAFLKQHVVILASTTNKELLDPAILRPGRFDVHIHVDFPDENARCAIIAQALEKVPVDYSTDPVLSSREVLATHLAKYTSGLSAGDVSAILREAAMASMRDNLETTTVAIKYVLQALSEATSSTTAPASSTPTPLFARRHDGANCIYALLGATTNKWNFIATEINSDSYECAKENVARNQLETLISIKRTHSNKLLLEPLQDEPPERKFDFVMCNPPFFDNINEADTNPDSSCMGSANEMVFPGGEVAFIGNLITESEMLQNRILWFTSMVGKKSSLRKLLALLREKKVKSTRTTEFFQGRTKRWGIAWTFSTDVMDDSFTKVLGKRKEAHRRQELSFQVPVKSEEEEVLQRIRGFVEAKVELQLSTDTTAQQEDQKEDEYETEEGQNWLICRLEQRGKVTDNNLTEVRSAGRVEIFALGEGFEVLTVFEEGDRASFWTMADMLQAATVRSGRQWRRKLRRQQHGQ